MRFVLHGEALDGTEDVLRHIDRLVDRVADEVHRLDVPDADRLEASHWYRSARGVRRDMLRTAASALPRQEKQRTGPHARSFDVRSESDARVADKLAHTPLSVVVEDEEAEGELLDIFIEELGSRELRALHQVNETVTPRALDYVNGGGVGAIPGRVRRLLEKAEREGRPARIFVMCDGDQRWPGDTTFSGLGDIDRVRRICAQHSVPCHVLAKRTAENYIPDAVLQAFRETLTEDDQKQRIDTLCGLGKEQRDHFPIRKGLNENERQAALAAGLYDPSELPILEALETRVLPKRPRPLKQLASNHREAFTPRGLRERDGAGEIERLLEAIVEEL